MMTVVLVLISKIPKTKKQHVVVCDNAFVKKEMVLRVLDEGFHMIGTFTGKGEFKGVKPFAKNPSFYSNSKTDILCEIVDLLNPSKNDICMIGRWVQLKTTLRSQTSGKTHTIYVTLWRDKKTVVQIFHSNRFSSP